MGWVVEKSSAKKGWVAEKDKPPGGVLSDLARSTWTGLKEAASTVAGTPGDLIDGVITGTVDRGLRAAGALTGRQVDTEGAKAVTRGALAAFRAPPTTTKINEERQGALGRDYQPQTRAGRYGRAVGQFAANAVAPGGALAKTAAVVGPALGAEFAAKLAPPEYEAGARAAGALVGGFGAAGMAARPIGPSVRGALAQPEPIDRAANILRKRTDLPAAQAQAGALRSAGAEPTFASVTDESGRGFVRAVASRSTPSRELVQRRAETSALNLPDRVSRQARNHISADARQPEQVVGDLEVARDASATRNYAEPYQAVVEVPDAVKDMLADDAGRAIIARARADAIENQDWGRQVELDQLLQPTRDGQLPRVSAATVDRLMIAARERGADFAANGQTYRARGALQRRDQLDGVLANVEDIAPARADYAAQSRNIEAAQAGNAFVRPGSTDEFTGALAQATDLAPAKATARRAVERAVGENTAAAPGVARKLAFAPEQQARNRALLGDEGAERLQASMAAEAKTNADLQYVAPNSGSPTQTRTADQENVGKFVAAAQDVGRAVTGGIGGIIDVVANRLKTAGLSDQQSALIADVATDPARLDDLLTRIASQPGGSRWVPVIQDVVANAKRSAALAPAYAQPVRALPSPAEQQTATR